MINPTCIGTGMVALDAIYGSGKQPPSFLAGGSCGNVLTILASFGWGAFPMARLGNDIEGERIIEDMKKWGTKTEFIQQERDTKTPRIIERVFAGKNPYHRFYLKCEHGKWLPQKKVLTLKSMRMIRDDLPSADVFYFDRATPSACELAQYLKQRNTIIVFEPPHFLSSDLFRRCLRTADIVKHCYDNSKSLEKLDVSIPLEIQTMGKEGLQYKTNFLRNTEWKMLPPFPAHNLIDAAGSGDWLSAGMIHHLRDCKTIMAVGRKRLKDALNFGQALASLNCNYVGARGMMYCLPQETITRLAERRVEDRQLVIKMGSEKIRTVSRIATKCRVCMCVN